MSALLVSGCSRSSSSPTPSPTPSALNAVTSAVVSSSATAEVTRVRPLLMPDASLGCEAVASQVVNDQPAVKDAMAAMKAEAKTTGQHIGGIGPQEDGRGGFSAAIGFNSARFFEGYVHYSVDRAGHLEADVRGSPVDIPDEQEAVVREACARRR
jgi:hypothetical protein